MPPKTKKAYEPTSDDHPAPDVENQAPSARTAHTNGNSRTEDKYVALFNTGEKVDTNPVVFQDMGLSGATHKIRDLWAREDLGGFKREFSPPTIPTTRVFTVALPNPCPCHHLLLHPQLRTRQNHA